jgi:DNA topoisomerase-1
MGRKISAQITGAPAAGDPAKFARAAHLIYVNDHDPGIQRMKRGKGFIYLDDDGKKICDELQILRIQKLRIPPAWKNVWICKSAEGHIQATGIDALGRKQYRYHPLWNELRNRTKFDRLLQFGEKLPVLRLQMETDMSLKDLCERKVLALVIGLMERTYIRIGNNGYEKLYGSYGLTTLKDQHVTISGSKMRFSFRGKKGIYHDISLTNRKLARIVKQCREIPGRELFQYYDDAGHRHAIDSGRVNNYLKEITGEDFTAKDFRTWAGTLNALRIFRQVGEAATDAERKKRIIEVIDQVSKQLGNTRTVCRKYYVHPLLIELYEKQALQNYFNQLDRIEDPDGLTGWTEDELLLLRILREQRG